MQTLDLLEYLKDHPEITTLVLDQCGFGPESARMLAESPYVQNIKHLDLRCANLGNEGAKYIFQSPYLQNLTRLDLLLNGITDTGIQSFASSNLSRLEHLDLSCNRFGIQGARALIASLINCNKFQTLTYVKHYNAHIEIGLSWERRRLLKNNLKFWSNSRILRFIGNVIG